MLYTSKPKEAPGFRIRSASSRGAYMKQHETSMSTLLSGAFALLLEAHPGKNTDEIIDATLNSSEDLLSAPF